MPNIYEMLNAPTTAEYVRALCGLGERVTEEHRLLFQAHYNAPERAITAKNLAAVAAIEGGWAVVNSRYGKLGHALCDYLGIKPQLRPDDTYQWWSVWSRGWNTPEGFVWQMLPAVATALEELGWVSNGDFALPDELPKPEVYIEGAKQTVVVNRYERDRGARVQCLKAHGTKCCVCTFDFGAVFGSEAEGYIHVHHLTPLSEIGEAYQIDPVRDLRPVCPNCHAMIHLGGRTRTIEEVRKLLHRNAPNTGESGS